MDFRITTHAGYGAPAGAIESLWPILQAASIEDATFAMGRDEIHASWGYDEGGRLRQEELLEPRRRELLEAICELCESGSGLQSDWYAIAPVR